MVQNVLLIWLDANIDAENNVDCRTLIRQLQSIVSNISTFTDSDQCIEFIGIIDNNNTKACMIISDLFGQDIVPRVHNMLQVDSIFILSNNKVNDEQWINDWCKIKGIFTKIASICEVLKDVVQQCEHNAIPISFMATNVDDYKKNLDELNCSFIYTQILKDILLKITFEEKHIKEFITHCCEQFADIESKLIYAKEFEKKYKNKTPIWWYTCESFLYPMLNTALRLMGVDVIIEIGFFISDLHHHVQQLHLEQCHQSQFHTNFTVYRGQVISINNFEQMTKTKDGLIAFNNFLSTSKVRDISLRFARRALLNLDLIGIHFVMTIDSSITSTPFASINDISYFNDKEDEILFSIHTVFRICDIKSIDENNRLYQVDLMFTSENDKDLRQLSDLLREETKELMGWDQLGELLIRMGQFAKAQQLYEILLEQTAENSDKARFYHRLGYAKHHQCYYDEALICYEKSLIIYQRLLPSNHPDLAKCYNSIGNVYYNINETSKAILAHEKALEIQEQSLSSNHPDLINLYSNIGEMYFQLGEYSKALLYYEKVMAIREKILPTNHPDFASSYNDIGAVYGNMDDYSKAFTYYEKALEIQQQSLPANHLDLVSSYNNIGETYENMNEHLKALSYYKKVLEIRQQSLPSNHFDLAKSYSSIGMVYFKVKEYSKALSYFETDFKISQKLLSPNHLHFASCFNNMDEVYKNMGNYSKASLLYERAVDIGQRLLPSNHPRLQKWQKNLTDTTRIYKAISFLRTQ